MHHICDEEQNKDVKVVFANFAAQQHFVEFAVVSPHFERLQQAIPNEYVEHQVKDVDDWTFPVGNCVFADCIERAEERKSDNPLADMHYFVRAFFFNEAREQVVKYYADNIWE